MSHIAENLQRVEKRIEEACVRAGRDRGEVTLIAVSKTKPVSDIQEAMACGITVFGENKVQELKQKTEEISAPLHWHMIGHLQTNKVKYLPGMAEMIHSVDRLELALEIDKQAQKHQMVMDVLLEVNVAREDTKFGLMVEETEPLLRQLALLKHIRVRGLMTIAPFTENAESNRRYFHTLREQKEELNRKEILEGQMDVLSMGMTGDYEIAIEEGATHVRVGTGIFGERNYSIS